MSDHPRNPIGAVLAGGRGQRIGGSKATVKLLGRPLISYPLAAVRAVLPEVVVVAKADTELPELGGVEVWVEPDEPRHPLVGILHAVERADGRPVFVCGADMPLLTPVVVERIAYAPAEGAPAVVASAGGGELEPLLARYLPAAADLLTREASVPLREAVAAIRPRLIEVGGDAAFNVNTREDLARAASRR